MSIARLVECASSTGSPTTSNQEQYVNANRFVRHCAANGLCTVRANNFGNNLGAGTGENYHDQSDPALDNAWIYSEWDNSAAGGVAILGFLLQYADVRAFGEVTAPRAGDPGEINETTLDGLAIAMAFREDGTSPWAGTTVGDGTDTKGATVWTPGASVVHVFPRSNGPGPPAGASNATKHNMKELDDSSGTCRTHWIANNDGLVWLHSNNDNGDYQCLYAGRYVPDPGLVSVITYPYVMVHAEATGFWVTGSGNVYGTSAGTGVREGGIIGRPGDGVMGLTVGPIAGVQQTAYQPNSLRDPIAFDGEPIKIFQDEHLGDGSAFVGTLPTELLCEVFNSNNQSLNGDRTRATMATSTQAASKFSVSWDNNAAPGLGSSRLGRLSFTA